MREARSRTWLAPLALGMVLGSGLTLVASAVLRPEPELEFSDTLAAREPAPDTAAPVMAPAEALPEAPTRAAGDAPAMPLPDNAGGPEEVAEAAEPAAPSAAAASAESDRQPSAAKPAADSAAAQPSARPAPAAQGAVAAAPRPAPSVAVRNPESAAPDATPRAAPAVADTRTVAADPPQPPGQTAQAPSPDPDSEEAKLAAAAQVRVKGGTVIDSMLDQALTPTKKTPAPTAAVVPKLPQTPSRDDVVKAMSVLVPAIRGCAQGHSGLAPVSIVVQSDGRVESAALSGGPFQGTASGRCMEGVVRRARFPRFKQPNFRVQFPFAVQ